MLQGFHVPRTPRGLSSLNPPPPWHYSCDLLSMEFWADPKHVAAMLPSPLEADSAADGHAAAYFVDWEFTGENDEYQDPERYQYREFFILVDAMYQGAPVSYCPYMFVDNDAALARGWIQGFPKRIGSVFQTRLHAAAGKSSSPLGQGRKFAASLSAHGRRLAEGTVTLEMQLQDAGSFTQRPVVNLLYTPQLSQAAVGAPAVSKLVMNIPKNVVLADAWVGSSSLQLPTALGEELSDLAPIRMGYGMRASMSYTVDDLKELCESPVTGS